MLRGYLEKELLLILWIQNRPVPLKDIIEIMQLVYTNQYSSYNSLKTTLIRTLNNLAQKGYVSYYKPYRRRYIITSKGKNYIESTQLFKSFLAYVKNKATVEVENREEEDS
ncbi:hypothetical protein DRJ16_03815 [Candidatus Woesearchaeota archaeon]|nr:MAG: hypothetical protein DRJ16_03815 [Candidatus Woesearchaeota archaeon]